MAALTAAATVNNEPAAAAGEAADGGLADLTKKMAEVDLSGMSKEQRKRFETARDDPELNVAKLIAKHREDIDTVKAACAKELSSPTAGGIAYDDLFVVRYLKSRKGDVEKTIESVKACVEWRTENKAWIEKAKAGEKAPKHGEISKLSIGGLYKNTVLGEPLYIVRAGISTPKELMKKFTPEEVVFWLNWNKEIGFQLCDKRTRASGRITKMFNVVDLRDSSFWNNDKSFFKCLGDSSKHSEKFYPQLLGLSIVINLPSWISAVMSLFSFLVPQSFLEKQRFCYGRPGSKKQKNFKDQKISKCPFASVFMDKADTPLFLGGEDAGCPYKP